MLASDSSPDELEAAGEAGGAIAPAGKTRPDDLPEVSVTGFTADGEVVPSLEER